MHVHFDGHRAFTYIEKLASLRRLPGTPGERMARAFIRGLGDSIGVPMHEQEFRYSSRPLKVFLPLTCLALGLICLAGSFTLLWSTSLAIIPGVVILLLIFISFRWSGAFERFGATGDSESSANLIGEVKSKGSKGTVILSAHYDSKSQLMLVSIRAGLFIIGFFTAVLLGIALLAAGILILTGNENIGAAAGFYVSLIPAVCLCLLALNFTDNRSPGALDNASGEAVILEVGRVLADKPLENLDVIIASFGCEEVGLVGSIKYLFANEERLRQKPLFMLNYDMPFSPAGNIYVNTGFELPPKHTSEHLNAIIREVAAGKGTDIKSIYLPVGAAADHMPWIKHGFEATAFVSPTPYIHSSRDTVDRINREGLRRVGEITLGVLARLDQELSSGDGGTQETEDFR